MKNVIIVSSRSLANACKKLRNLKNRKRIPALDYYLIECSSNEIWISHTDMETIIRIKVFGEANFDGAFLISEEIGVLADKMEEQPLNISFYPDMPDKIHVSGDSVSVSLITYDPGDYPNLSEWREGFTLVGSMDHATFMDIMKDMSMYVSTDGLRANLNGINIDNERFVATNGHYLKMIENKWFSVHAPVIIRDLFKYIPKLRRNSGSHEVSLLLSSKYSMLKWENYEIISTMIDETFPGYQHIIPQKFTHEFKVKNSDLTKAVTEALAFVSKEGNTIRFSMSGNSLDVMSRSSVLESQFNKTIAIDYISGEDVLFSLNGNLLLNTLKTRREDVLVQFDKDRNVFFLNQDTLLMGLYI